MKRHFWTTISVLICTASSAWAFQPTNQTKSRAGEPSLKKNRGLGERILRFGPEVLTHTKDRDSHDVEIDPVDGEARVLSGKFSFKMDRRQDIQSHVSAIAAQLGAQRLDLRLSEKNTHYLTDYAFVQFDRYENNLPVEGAILQLRYNRGQLVQVINRLYVNASVANGKMKSRINLAARVSGDAGVTVRDLKDLYRVEYGKNGYELRRAARAVVQNATGAWQYTVDAATGRFLEIKNLMHHGSGQVTAHILPRTLTDAFVDVPLSLNQIKGAGTVTFTDANGLFTFTSGSDLTYTLSTKNFEITSVVTPTATVTKPANSPSFDLFWENSNSTLAERTAAYHAEKLRRYVKGEYEKYGKTSPWFDTVLPIIVNMDSVCNAYYFQDALHFFKAGAGCNNTGEISDILFHEWGHALDDHVAGGISDDAYSEGIGDINSIMMTGSPEIGPGFWTNGAPVREVATDYIYPRDANQEIHFSGQIIGSTYYDLLQALLEAYGDDTGHALAAKYFYLSILTASHYTDNYQAVLTIDDDNGNLSDGTPNFCLINKVFASHGLATLDAACADRVEVISKVTSDNLPGTTSTIDLALKNLTAIDQNNIELKLQSWSPLVTVLSSPVSASLTPNQTAALPAMQLGIGAGAVCNNAYKVSVVRQWDNRIERTPLTLIVGKGAEGQAQQPSGSVNLPIPDNSATGVISPVSLSGAATYVSGPIAVTMTIDHSYPRDLTAVLIAPSGKQVTIFSRPTGLTAHGFTKTFTVDGFTREALAGNWRLYVRDSYPRDSGTLNSWSISIPTYVSNCP